MASNNIPPKSFEQKFRERLRERLGVHKTSQKKVEKRKAEMPLEFQSIKKESAESQFTFENLPEAINYCTLNSSILENMDQPIGNMEKKAMEYISQSNKTMSEMHLIIKAMGLELDQLKTLLLNADQYSTNTTSENSNAREILEILDTDTKVPFVQTDKLKNAIKAGIESESQINDSIAGLKLAIYTRLENMSE